MNSSRRAEVVEVHLTPHPNADTLSVVPVYAYTYVAKTAEWQGVRRAAWVPPDTVVDTRRPEFASLAPQADARGMFRVRAKKLRGVVSYGLLVPVPDDTPVGADRWVALGLEHYQPAERGPGGKKALFSPEENVQGPPLFFDPPVYDLEHLLRYPELFRPGEPVAVHEKLDGRNCRYVWSGGRMHCGSRHAWKAEYPAFRHVTAESLRARGVPEEQVQEILARLARPQERTIEHEVLARHEAVTAFCRSHPGLVVYGEIHGRTNLIKYGFPDVNRFAAFDLFDSSSGAWLDWEDARVLAAEHGLPWAPRLHDGPTVPFDLDWLLGRLEGDTLAEGAAAGVMREGLVVRPARERRDPRLGRVALKAVSPAFLEKYR